MISSSKYKNLNRLKNALVTNASLNQIDAFKVNYKLCLSNHTNKELFMSELLYFAYKNLSKDVVEFLIGDGVKCNYASCIYDCKYNLLEDVYNYINEMIDKYGSLTDNTIQINKCMIIRRLIEPDKANVNRDRISYTIDLIRKGFLDPIEVKKMANELYKSDKYKGTFLMMTRELLLTELGI